VNKATDGVYVINKKGQVLSISCDENALVPFIQTSCAYLQNNDKIAFNLAKLNGLPGADGAFQEMY
jgi:clathrin heavy chain